MYWVICRWCIVYWVCFCCLGISWVMCCCYLVLGWLVWGWFLWDLCFVLFCESFLVFVVCVLYGWWLLVCVYLRFLVKVCLRWCFCVCCVFGFWFSVRVCWIDCVWCVWLWLFWWRVCVRFFSWYCLWSLMVFLVDVRVRCCIVGVFWLVVLVLGLCILVCNCVCWCLVLVLLCCGWLIVVGVVLLDCVYLVLVGCLVDGGLISGCCFGSNLVRVLWVWVWLWWCFSVDVGVVVVWCLGWLVLLVELVVVVGLVEEVLVCGWG